MATVPALSQKARHGAAEFPSIQEPPPTPKGKQASLSETSHAEYLKNIASKKLFLTYS